MRTSLSSVMELMKCDPARTGEAPWLDERGFSVYYPDDEPGSALSNFQDLMVAYRNDIHGLQYFTSCVLPGMRADAACRAIWRERGMRHCLCTDGAPKLVVCPVGLESRRVEYQVLPAVHAMSSIASQGMQYDVRDALVTSWRFSQPLQLDSGETVNCSCILQKSVIFPQYSPKDFRSTSVGQGPAPGERGQRPSVGPGRRGSAASSKGKLPELPPKETFMVEGLTRETVKLRGWVFYDLPDGQGAGMCFLCHEEVMGWSSQLGTLAYYMSYGTASGGAGMKVEHILGRAWEVLEADVKKGAGGAFASTMGTSAASPEAEYD